MDPAGLAPASPDAQAGILTAYTTGPGPQNYYKTKELLLQGILCEHPEKPVVYEYSGFVNVILPDFKNLSRSNLRLKIPKTTFNASLFF